MKKTVSAYPLHTLLAWTLLLAITLFLLPFVTYSACSGATCAATSTQNTTFSANLYVNGAVSKGSGSFVIDHPLDPKNKLLYHFFLESPDVKNTYDGIATLDKNASVTIELPEYFLALNKDFRYLATPIGEPMPNLHIAREIAPRFFGLFGKTIFKIEGGAAHGRISWQVSGIRHDPFIEANPVIVEVDKDTMDLAPKGTYLHPEAYKQ